MSTPGRNDRQIDVPAGFGRDAGRWVWTMQDTRGRTKRALEGVTTQVLDWTGSGTNSIGTLLYHVVAIEMDWLNVDILGRTEFPTEVDSLLPHDVRDDNGLLVAVSGSTLQEHLDRLDAARDTFLSELSSLSDEELHLVRHLPDYSVTPEWAIHHLIQHEAEHRGQIMELRTLAERAL